MGTGGTALPGQGDLRGCRSHEHHSVMVGLYPSLRGPCSLLTPNQPGPQDAKTSPCWRRLEAGQFIFPCFLSTGHRWDVLPPTTPPRAVRWG